MSAQDGRSGVNFGKRSLEELKAVCPELDCEKLAAVGIGTVREFIALTREPDAAERMREYLKLDEGEFRQLRETAGSMLAEEELKTFEQAPVKFYPTGALIPDDEDEGTEV